MASIESRINADGSKSYHVKIRIKKYPQQNASFIRLTDAKRWALSTEAAIREGRFSKNSASKRHTLGETIERYIEEILPGKPGSYAQKYQLQWWKQELGYSTLADLTPALIGEYRNKLANTPVLTKQKGEPSKNESRTRSPSTVVRYLAALSHVLSTAVMEWQLLDINPTVRVKKPKEPRGRERFLSDQERDQLLSYCRESVHPYLYTIVVLAISTGMRKGELMSLRWSQVDFKAQRITLYKTKNGERRSVPLVSHALVLLQMLNSNRRPDSDLLFPGKSGISPIEINKPWYNALEAAKIENFRFHDLRHSAASYLAMGGASLLEIANVLGHKTLSMVKRYSHISDNHTADVVSKMNNKIFNQGVSNA